MKYETALKKAIDEAKPTTGLSRSEVETRIANITAELKKPCSNADRIMLCADRQTLRLALRDL